MSKLDDFFDTIKNGTWHSLDRLSQKLGLTKERLVDMAKFLSQLGLVKFDQEDRWVKISPRWRSIIFEEEGVEKKPAIGTIIIPPAQSLLIQNVKISNETEETIEFGISVGKEIMKLAVTRIG